MKKLRQFAFLYIKKPVCFYKYITVVKRQFSDA